MFKRNCVGIVLLMAAAVSLAGDVAWAGICGFPGLIGNGAVAGGTSYVILFAVAPPFGWSGTGTVPIAGVLGTPCREQWRDALLGPAPPNFQAIWSAAPAACAAGGCVGPAVCTAPGGGGATLCSSF